MNTHRIEVAPVSLTSTGYRYEVRDRETGEVLIGRSKVPTCDAARVLHAYGAADDDRIETYRPGSPVLRLAGTVGHFRKLTVREDEKTGPRYVPYKARQIIDA